LTPAGLADLPGQPAAPKREWPKQSPEGVAADSHGTIYAAAVQAKEVYKYVRK